MIAIPNFSPKDGLYYIDNGRIHKYKGKGGTVRVYDLIEIDLVRCGECIYWHEHEWYNTCDKHIGHGFEDDYFCKDGERRADGDI